MYIGKAYDGRILVELPAWMARFFVGKHSFRVGLYIHPGKSFRHLLIIFR